ncbi:MAG: bifunctional methylenetetrahydrofolate dehydrogenase/methenyltetrahydrofolate cyclohydrolase FolD [Anaerolineae bacterium]
MSARVIDGRAVAARIQAQIAQEVTEFKTQYGYVPGLGVVLVGDDPASATYVRMKSRDAESVGIMAQGHHLPASSTQAEVEQAVQALNNDPQIHGILVQLPLPKHLDEEAVLRAVSLDKDADGLHPLNIGLLAMKGREPLFTPATPTGCMVLLEEAGAELRGATAVVVGRSNIVGLPVALMLNKADATVTLAHSRTRNLPELLKEADIVIAAAGQAYFIKGEWLKPGAVVIDVGTNSVDDPTNERGYKLVGDVDFDSAKDVVSVITRVPGGVGPLTRTMLLQNTLKAAKRLATSQQ